MKTGFVKNSLKYLQSLARPEGFRTSDPQIRSLVSLACLDLDRGSVKVAAGPRNQLKAQDTAYFERGARAGALRLSGKARKSLWLDIRSSDD